MAREPNEKVKEAHKLYKKGIKLVEIADKLEIPSGTVRRWKSTYKWDGESESERSDKKANVRYERKSRNKTVARSEVQEIMQNAELNDKQRLFCIYYIRSFNATKAYQKAYGCDYVSAMQNGSRMLRNDKVKQEILRLKQDKFNREFLSEADIFQKYMDIAFADITDFMMFSNEEVNFTDELGNDRKAIISHVNVKNDSEVDGTIISEISKGKDGVKIKLADRMKALQWLAEHMDIATEEQKIKIELLRAKVERDDEETEDDGFLEALNATAREDWSDEEN